MSDRPDSTEPSGQNEDLAGQVARKEDRKLWARRRGNDSVWFGLGMFGLIGWSVAVPTLIGIALGIWIDRRWPSRFSWTLMLLVIGVAIGCLNAWAWVSRERQRIMSRRTEKRRE